MGVDDTRERTLIAVISDWLEMTTVQPLPALVGKTEIQPPKPTSIKMEL
jgi:hypothetical protein